MGVREASTKSVKVRTKSPPPTRVRNRSELAPTPELCRAEAGSTPPRGGVAPGNCSPGSPPGRGAPSGGRGSAAGCGHGLWSGGGNELLEPRLPGWAGTSRGQQVLSASPLDPDWRPAGGRRGGWGRAGGARGRVPVLRATDWPSACGIG